MAKKAKRTTRVKMVRWDMMLRDEQIAMIQSALALAKEHFGVTTDAEAFNALIEWFLNNPPSRERLDAIAEALDLERDIQNEGSLAAAVHFMWTITGKTLAPEGTG